MKPLKIIRGYAFLVAGYHGLLSILGLLSLPTLHVAVKLTWGVAISDQPEIAVLLRFYFAYVLFFSAFALILASRPVQFRSLFILPAGLMFIEAIVSIISWPTLATVLGLSSGYILGSLVLSFVLQIGFVWSYMWLKKNTG